MADVAMRTVALAKRFGGLTAVNDVSLELTVGEIHAVIGPNGAGKTTLVNLLSGDLKPTSGDVFLGEKGITALSADKRGLLGISDSTIFENVGLAVQAHAARPLALMEGAKLEHEQQARTNAALDRVALRERANVRAGSLSHGEQRQLEIAMVIATDPKVVLLDEPLAGMSQSESRTMVALIGTLRAGRAVLLVEHDMDAVFAVADRLTVMADGRVIASGAPMEVRLHPAVRTAYLGAETLT
jgi:branched-chain amino acid transport system ATP-binding protein